MSIEPMRRIPVAAPDLSGNEEAYVGEAIRSSWISSTGPFVERFEREFAAACGTSTALGVCNGTVALHLALLAQGRSGALSDSEKHATVGLPTSEKAGVEPGHNGGRPGSTRQPQARGRPHVIPFARAHHHVQPIVDGLVAP